MESLIEKLKKFPAAEKSGHGHKKEHKHKHKHKLRECCAKVVVDRVLADRIFRCCETTGPCDLGIRFPRGSVVCGTITVTVLECRPVFCEPQRPVRVNILLLIQKEFVVTEPNGRKTPLEFTFHKRCHRVFPPIFTLDCVNPRHVDCLVFEIKKVCADVDFVCSNPAFHRHATIAERLEVVLLLKLVVKEQLEFELCRHHRKED